MRSRVLEIIRSTFRSCDARRELSRRAGEILSGGERWSESEAGVVFYLAVLALMQSGQRAQPRVRPVRRWLVRQGIAVRAAAFVPADFQHDGQRWGIRNHPECYRQWETRQRCAIGSNTTGGCRE